MEEKNSQEMTLMSNFFEIPIEKFEEDIDTESSKVKIDEILDLFTNSNNLRTEDEFNEIKFRLHTACQEGDLELIKILLSETIKTQELTFKINKVNQTASLLDANCQIENLIVPRTVKHESVDYFITSVCGINNKTKTLKFIKDSAVKIFYGHLSRYFYPSIKEICFPSSLVELKEGWCELADKLKKITISPHNGQFIFKDNKYLLGKSDKNNDEFDTLLFASRDIKEICIPSNIKIISSYAFENCKNLTKIKFQPNSNLQIIKPNAFYFSNINEMFIPSKVSKICHDAFFCTNIKEIYFTDGLKELEKGWCSNTTFLTKITISPSNGQFVFKDNKYLLGKSDKNNDEFDILLFASRDIKEICIPSNIKIISSYAFENCSNLTKVEIPPNSNLQIIESDAFSQTNIKKIFIPSKVLKICECAFRNCNNLTEVEIPPNSNLQTIESYAFLNSKINEIFIPSKVSKICDNAFRFCENLTKVEIWPDSNLKTIESGAFAKTEISEIYFPSGLVELKEGWCKLANKLKIIKISPSNDQFIFKDNKYLLGKSDKNNDEFDILLFASRDIKEISIPSNIKIISSCAFEKCSNLTKVEIPPNSNLQTIESYAFSWINIKKLSIPSTVSKICKYAFSFSKNLTKIEIPPNSNLLAIESNVFTCTNIKGISIPSNVSKICNDAFDRSKNLQIVEISEESKLESFRLSAFEKNKNIILMITQSLKKLFHPNKPF